MLIEIEKKGRRYWHYGEEYTVISWIYFKKIYLIQTYTNLASKDQLIVLELFYSVLEQLEEEESALILEKYFTKASMASSLDKEYTSITYELINTFKYKPISDIPHSKALNMSITKYSKIVDKILQKFIRKLVELKIERAKSEKEDN